MEENTQTADVNVANSQEVPTTKTADGENLLGQATEETADGESLLGQANEEEKSDATEQVEKKDGEEGETKNADVAEIDFEKDIVLPEGFVLDDELLEQFKPIVKDLNLSKEQTQKLIDLQIKSLQKIETQNKQNFEETKKTLATETKKMLGANWKKELAYASKSKNLLSETERVELDDVLNVSGIGNHPALVNYFVKVGKLISEDRFVAGQPISPVKDMLELMGRGDLKK